MHFSLHTSICYYCFQLCCYSFAEGAELEVNNFCMLYKSSELRRGERAGTRNSLHVPMSCWHEVFVPEAFGCVACRAEMGLLKLVPCERCHAVLTPALHLSRQLQFLPIVLPVGFVNLSGMCSSLC